MAPLAWLLVATLLSTNGTMAPVLVSGIATEQACHGVALQLNVPNHKCISYEMAGATKLVEVEADGDAVAANCEAEGIKYHCQQPREPEPPHRGLKHRRVATPPRPLFGFW